MAVSSFFVKRFLFPLLATLALPTAVNANTQVTDSLNTAEMAFRMGAKDLACNMVSLAIFAANTPEIYGTTSSSLKREVKEYADRCDLRF